MTLDVVAADFWERLVSLFLVDRNGSRPCFGGVQRMQTDPRWRNNLLFHEYFHGDNGAGLGASHQTGWTGLVADVIRRRHHAYPKASEVIQRLVQGGDRVSATILPGRPAPLGATPGPQGTNFAVSSNGDEVRLCLFSGDGSETQLLLPERDGDVWHGFVPGVAPGQAYGYRVSGPYDRARGLRYNPAKLLLDPYARAIHGDVRFGPELFDYAMDNAGAPSPLDSAGQMPRSLVTAPALTPLSPGPGHALADTILYEVHVRGFTAKHPGVPPELRGTYAGLAHEAAVQHLVDLGVTTVELLPIHHNVPESFLVERGLTNYWGYNTIGFFAPHAAYSAAVRAGRPGGQVEEFRNMVAALHAAGLEVVLDVVFNHTAEGGAGGPTLCHRGLDNAAYYRLEPSDLSRYVDTTGCGNSLNTADATTLRMIMDSLRYWVSEMGVDGFRFDLAPTLGREDGALRPVFGVLRRRRPGSRRVAGEAHRGAMGCRPHGQLRHRPVSATVE